MSKKCVVNRNDNGDITSVEVVNLSYTPNTDNLKFSIDNENQSGINVSEAIKLNNNNPLNLAPNGKPSILYNTYKEMGYSEEETIKLVSEVYSERFRNFFGDWLNNPENSSKVVDENGQPKIVWSGHVSSTITSNINGAQFQGYRIYGNEYNNFKQDGEKPQDYRFSNTALFVEDKKLALTYSTGIDAFNTSESFMQKYAPKDSFLEPVFLNIRKYEEVEEVSNKIIPRIDGSIEEGIDGFYGGNRAPYKDFKTWAILDENQVLNAKSPDYINNDVILLNNVVKVLSNKGLTSDVYLMTNDEIVEKLKQLGISENIARELVLKHGSPHKFDKFSTEKIGIGEGAQAFGWGLYFTDLDSIAKEYAKRLKPDLALENETINNIAKEALNEFNGDKTKAINSLQELLKESWSDKKRVNKAIKILKTGKELNTKLSKVYTITLHKGKQPSEYTFLEWDRSVSPEVFKKINDLAISKNDVIIKMLSEGINTENIEGSALYKNLSRQLGSDKAASLFLLEAGIDGIKYPAESISRGTTSDTARGFNYVVFDDNAITIENVTSFSKSLIDNGLATVVGGFYRKDTRQIFINKESNDVLNTTIHEFSHPMIGWLIENRRDLFEAGIKLLKENKSEVKNYIERVNKLYPDLKENSDAYWEEVMAELIANNGVEIINREKKSDIVKWLENIWNAFKNMVGITGYTAEDVSNMTVKEFANAVNAEMFNEVSLDTLLRVGRNIGYNFDTELTARERFDISKLKRINAGSDRIVYELDDNKVIKIAKTARGLMQNIYEGDYDLVEEELLPDIYERGLNYVIVEKVPPIKARDLVPTYDVDGEQIGTEKAEKMFADFSKFSQFDFDSDSQKLIDTLYKYGMFYIVNREVLFGDFSRKANWGIKNGKPIHLDGGTFAGTRLLSKYRGKSNLEDEDFKEVYNRSKSFKKIIGDRDRNTMFSLIDNSEIQANGTFTEAPNGNAVQLQKGNQRLTPITKQAFDALVTKLQKAFPGFAKVTYDFEAFKKQAEKLGATFNDIQRMVMAFHGSPHSFDKFSTDYMGTGEGRQAFGWGLYFTDLESIARNYASKLSKRKHIYQTIPSKMADDLNELGVGGSSLSDKETLLDNIKYRLRRLKSDIYDFENGSLEEDFKDLKDDWKDDWHELKEFYSKNYKFSKHSEKYQKISDLYTENFTLDDFIKIQNLHNEIFQEDITQLEEFKGYIENLPEKQKPTRVLYNITLHKGKQPSEYTWLEWDKEVPQEVFKKINDLAISKNDVIIKMLSEGINTENIEGSALYKNLSRQLGSDKLASLFLLEAGIDGVKYPAESISRGTTSDTARGFNYVVFDENAITIEDKIQFMQTPNGTIYGAKLPDGTIYLNSEFLNANTPIHEFSHLFEQLLPSRFKSGIELLKQTDLGKKLFEQLKQEGNYANLTDEQLWGEALNTHIGNFGENEVNNPKGKLKQLQDWIRDFFTKVGDVLGIKKLSPDTQLRMFTEGVVKDLLGGKPIVVEKQVSPSEQVQYSFLTENDYDANGNIKPEVLAEIQAEREAIKSEAQANGTFMKAPNGKATNLNEAQWIDVRTKRFKDWFGDWQNDLENSSKVVDENGEPMVVQEVFINSKYKIIKEC